MTQKEKENQYECEQKIARLIMEYQKESGLKVDAIRFHSILINGCSLPTPIVFIEVSNPEYH